MPRETPTVKILLTAMTASLALTLAVTPVSAVALYDGSLTNKRPADQGWRYENTSLPQGPFEVSVGNGIVLDTTGNILNLAGYFKQPPITLNRTTGYTIRFTIQVNSEDHGSNSNRAGLSLIVISSQLAGETQPFGLELGFWQNSIFAQNTSFRRAESVAFNTQSALRSYRLRVKGNRYQLFANGVSRPILRGLLRQYQFTPPAGYPNPYTFPNLVFMGDNTTSARARVTITSVTAN